MVLQKTAASNQPCTRTCPVMYQDKMFYIVVHKSGIQASSYSLVAFTFNCQQGWCGGVS